MNLEQPVSQKERTQNNENIFCGSDEDNTNILKSDKS